MYYYTVALPLKIDKEYIYKSKEKIISGCRVIVNFHNLIKTGIIFNEVTEVDEAITYNAIMEIIDLKPMMNDEQMKLASWISRYYKIPIGQVIYAMMPKALDITIQQKIRKLKYQGILNNRTKKEILNQLVDNEWYEILEIKRKVKIANYYHILEEMERDKLIAISRSYDNKIKKKVINYVIRNLEKEIPILTSKQQKAFEIINEEGEEFPLSKIAKKISYSMVKTLRNKGLITIKPREVEQKSNLFSEILEIEEKRINYTSEQKGVIEEIQSAVQREEYQTFLLHGITGSGKTEIYIESIKYALEINRNALLLVPEISLTPQLLSKFYAKFGDSIAILHSKLNERERWEQWEKIRSGECNIVIGVRSAVFSPITNIGVIIVDEEHETSYKQDTQPRYNARDISVIRGKFNNCPVILGSATPSLESWNNVQNKKYKLLKLKNRPYKTKLPSTQVLDLREFTNKKSAVSPLLAEKIEDRIKKHEQVILFQNRRGYSSFMQCTTCGHLLTCPNCDISYKYHSYDSTLKCHYCGNTINIPRKCPKCGSYVFKYGSLGTQQLESQLKVLFPSARILRMDSDTASKKNSYTSMFERMKKGQLDILLGTQMIAKGLDFENVTLVGVVSADTILNFPDFRSGERTFQLLTQVAGRSGRGSKNGEVIIQTYNPEHYAIRFALEQDFIKFAEKEYHLRKMLLYPPYFHLGRVIFQHKDDKFLKFQLAKNQRIFRKLEGIYSYNEFRLLGPVSAPLSKINNNFRMHIIIKSKNAKILLDSMEFIKNNLKMSSTIRTIIDIDPYGLL